MSRGITRGRVAVVLAAVCLSWSSGPLARAAEPVQSPAVTPMSDAARAELAPGGRLRAGLNSSNTLLVSTPAPNATGVAPDLARELARRAGATVTFVGYANAGLVADAAAAEAWDIAFIGAEPERAGHLTFSPAYVQIEATYLVRAGSSYRTQADLDRAGTRIVSAARAAYTLSLQRSLREATLVEAEGLDGAFARFTDGEFDALAGLRPRLEEDATKVPGARVLEGRFTAVQQAMAVPKGRIAAADYLTAFAAEIKRSGLLQSLIGKHSIRGLTVAP